MDFFTNLYYAKKAMLMVECIDNNFKRVEEVFETISPALASAVDLSDITAVATQYFEGIKALYVTTSHEIARRVAELAERYEDTLPSLESDVDIYEAKVKAHLERMGFVW